MPLQLRPQFALHLAADHQVGGKGLIGGTFALARDAAQILPLQGRGIGRILQLQGEERLIHRLDAPGGELDDFLGRLPRRSAAAGDPG